MPILRKAWGGGCTGITFLHRSLKPCSKLLSTLQKNETLCNIASLNPGSSLMKFNLPPNQSCVLFSLLILLPFGCSKYHAKQTQFLGENSWPNKPSVCVWGNLAGVGRIPHLTSLVPYSTYLLHWALETRKMGRTLCGLLLESQWHIHSSSYWGHIPWSLGFFVGFFSSLSFYYTSCSINQQSLSIQISLHMHNPPSLLPTWSKPPLFLI